VFRRVFQELPILQFLRSMPIVSGNTATQTLLGGSRANLSNFEGSTQPFTSNLSAIGPIVSESGKTATPDRILAAAKSLLPLPEFEKEVPGLDITLDNIRHNAATQILKVVTYAISNNFPGHGDRTEIYGWLKRLGASNPGIIQQLQVSPNHAPLQGLFRLAVEKEDVSLVRTLLNAGANPNENVCVLSECPIPLRPLQYACLHGNLELIKELLQAKAQVDLEFGWSCSPLVFAIYGCFTKGWGPLSEGEAIEDEVASAMHPSVDQDELKERRLDALLILIREILDAGADINAISVRSDDIEHTINEWRKSLYETSDWHNLIHENHSALTLGSSFQCPKLVDFLVRNGSNVNARLSGDWSALRKCIYPLLQRRFDSYGVPRTLVTCLARCENTVVPSRFEVLETAKRLIAFGVDVNDHEPCHLYDNGYCEVHHYFECYSAFDLGILTQDRELVDSLLLTGAKPTVRSFDLAIETEDFDTFCQLLGSDVMFPAWAITPDEYSEESPAEDDSDEDGFDCGNSDGAKDEGRLGCMGSRMASAQQRTRAMILAAIQTGACASLQTIARSCDGSNIFDSCDALPRAIEKCCLRGHLETLTYLLGSKILPQDSLLSILGSSVVSAVRGNNPEMVDLLLAAGADVNAEDRAAGDPDDWLDTPLSLAIREERKEMIQKLLGYGAEVETPTLGNLLVLAMEVGNLDNLQLLMAYASPNNVGGEFNLDEPLHPLSAAIFLENHLAVVDKLLELGASVNPAGQITRPLRYGTPLWAAVYVEALATVKLLFEIGAEANDEWAMERAAACENPAFLTLLLEKLSTEDGSGEEDVLDAALREAMFQGRLRNFRLILQSNIFDPRDCPECVHNALSSPTAHRREFVQSLLDAGASPDNIVDEFFMGESREDFNNGGPHNTLIAAVHTQDPACVRMILDARGSANHDLTSQSAYSPLQLAAFGGNIEVTRLLLDHGQDPNLVSPCSETHQLRYFQREFHRNARPFGTSVQNATTKKHLEVLKTLLQYGANPNSKSCCCCPDTPLQIACRDGSLELVELLIEYGADINAPPAKEFGATALQFAAIGGYLGIAHLLLEKGADVNAVPAEVEGRTALEGAAEHGRIDMVQLLKNAGADISDSEKGRQYERALDRAKRNGHSATTKLLESFLSYL